MASTTPPDPDKSQATGVPQRPEKDRRRRSAAEGESNNRVRRLAQRRWEALKKLNARLKRPR